MRRANLKSRCLRDLKRIKERGLDEERFHEVLGLLMVDGRVPSHRKPHKLSGKYEGYWECHIAGDWLLVYDVTDREVIVYRTGSHADLFE